MSGVFSIVHATVSYIPCTHAMLANCLTGMLAHNIDVDEFARYQCWVMLDI